MPPTLPVDYTRLDYDALREAMLELAQESLPEWTDLSENDLGVLLVELFAYACDVTQYYQTRIAANLLPATSDEPQALVQLLRLIGYELAPAAPAVMQVELAFDAGEPTPILVPARTRFFATSTAGEQLVFETPRALEIAGGQLTPPDTQGLRHLLFPVPAVEGSSVVDEALAQSDGSPNQLYRLRDKPVIAGSVEVVVTEPGSDTRWQAVDSLAASTPADRHFVVQRDAEGGAECLFGDGINGMIPPQGAPATPVTIRASYRVGGGPEGNLPASSELRSSLASIVRATNPQAAAGGADGEPIARARDFAPALFRTQGRAVTGRDYAELALKVPGVGKARAAAADWNRVLLWVAPAGRVEEPSELLKQDLLAFFEPLRMASTEVRVLGPEPADVYLRATVRAEPYYLRADVRRAVEEAVAAYLDFDAVDFGQPIYLSRVYDAIQSLPEVASLTLTEFSRVPDGTVATAGVIELGPAELPRPGYRDNPATPPPAPADPADLSVRPPIVIELIGGAT